MEFQAQLSPRQTVALRHQALKTYFQAAWCLWAPAYVSTE